MINESLTRTSPSPARSRRAPQAMLQGVKRQDWRARPEAARNVGAQARWAWRDRLLGHSAGRAAGPKSSATSSARRPRQRTRLRSAKAARRRLPLPVRGPHLRPLLRRSASRARCATSRCRPGLAVHIDETAEVREASVIWRRGSTIGIRLHAAAPPGAMRPCDRYALKERYYAIPG